MCKKPNASRKKKKIEILNSIDGFTPKCLPTIEAQGYREVENMRDMEDRLRWSNRDPTGILEGADWGRRRYLKIVIENFSEPPERKALEPRIPIKSEEKNLKESQSQIPHS